MTDREAARNPRQAGCGGRESKEKETVEAGRGTRRLAEKQRGGEDLRSSRVPGVEAPEAPFLLPLLREAPRPLRASAVRSSSSLLLASNSLEVLLEVEVWPDLLGEFLSRRLPLVLLLLVSSSSDSPQAM
jgi:hypothetical protein